eukprot:764907-Pelagomonas_calceolata.AAC.7
MAVATALYPSFACHTFKCGHAIHLQLRACKQRLNASRRAVAKPTDVGRKAPAASELPGQQQGSSRKKDSKRSKRAKQNDRAAALSPSSLWETAYQGYLQNLKPA